MVGGRERWCQQIDVPRFFLFRCMFLGQCTLKLITLSLWGLQCAESIPIGKVHLPPPPAPSKGTSSERAPHLSQFVNPTPSPPTQWVGECVTPPSPVGPVGVVQRKLRWLFGSAGQLP